MQRNLFELVAEYISSKLERVHYFRDFVIDYLEQGGRKYEVKVKGFGLRPYIKFDRKLVHIYKSWYRSRSHRQDTTKWGGVAQTPAQCHNTATFQTKIPRITTTNCRAQHKKSMFVILSQKQICISVWSFNN